MRLLIKIFILFIIINLVAFTRCNAQDKNDSIPKNKKHTIGKWFQQGIKSITRHSHDTTDFRAAYNTRVATYYQPYAGKIIRHIEYRQYGFERSFSDTMSRMKYFGTNILNHLHTRSKSWVIRNNMFVKEGMPLNPNIVADNERYLRSLNFIRDARILVQTIDPGSDSVDIMVVTKDLFSLTGEIHDLSTDKQYLNIRDVNFLGLGQNVSGSFLHDNGRSPAYGGEVDYTKYNLFNSFTNLEFRYTNIGKNIYTLKHEEHGAYLNFDRPLYSQYARYYWDLHLSDVWSEPNYEGRNVDSINFYHYRYKMFDATVGINLGADKGRRNLKIPFRSVISLRYYNYDFLKSPVQFYDRFVENLNAREALLVQYTMFKQNFFKTNYVLGFGATEDIPYGFNLSVTGGWYKISPAGGWSVGMKNLSRPFIGFDGNEYLHTNKGDIIQFFSRAGGFFNKGLQDATALTGISAYSRLWLWKGFKVRQFMRLSYTGQFNRYIAEPLRINNDFGLEGFKNDSIQGTRRLTLRSQTVMYMPGKLLGFAFAPFLTGDISYIKQTKISSAFYNSSVYYSIGGGIRLRNENLVFGTIELKGLYFPRSIAGENRFKIGITTDIRFRYNSSYVSLPSLPEYNSDVNNDIF
ncbi:MAG: hypothetical protein PW786_06070 [Arachidicoccus sp.]|nr:hypothetical protein [Arachidicoccus sp.]